MGEQGQVGAGVEGQQLRTRERPCQTQTRLSINAVDNYDSVLDEPAAG